MKYILTFENFTTEIPKAVSIENKMSLMDKTIDKEITQEEIEELEEAEKEREKRTKLKKNKSVQNK